MTSIIYIHFVAIVIYVYFFGLLTAQRIHDPVNKALRLFVLTAFGWAFIELLLYFPFASGNELFLKRLTGLFWGPLTFTFLRFLVAYSRGAGPWSRQRTRLLARAVEAKERRMAAHRPKWG